MPHAYIRFWILTFSRYAPNHQNSRLFRQPRNCARSPASKDVQLTERSEAIYISANYVKENPDLLWEIGSEEILII